jgi:amino acid transporter/nucleotide-binding universal stress UspA family protein
MGALLLVANFTVTAAMSAWAAMSYFGLPPEFIRWLTIVVILLIGVINFFGPKHSGSFATALALPTVIVVLLIIGLSLPFLTTANLEWPKNGFKANWISFVGVILALSGVEAVANLTGVMKLDPDATMENPRVIRTARKAIWPVALEVVIGTTMLGWAMLSLPRKLEPAMREHWEYMLRYIGEQYGTMIWNTHFGQVVGIIVGVVIGLLLLSAVNTAISALIGLIYMMARDGEMPRPFTRLNSHGVPWIPLILSVVLPILVALVSPDLTTLAGLYAIGVVGAITVNLGSCTFNKSLALKWYERGIMGISFLILFVVEMTIAYTKNDALFFACCVLGLGFGLRWYAQKRAGFETVTLTREIAAVMNPERVATLQPNVAPGQSILVAARGLTPVLRYALEEAKLRQGTLYVLYVKQLAVNLLGPLANRTRPRWQDDRRAAEIMCGMFDLAKTAGVNVLPVYAVSDDPAATILDITATLGVDMLMLGAPHRTAMAKLLSGDVVTAVARNLPENIQLVIHS